MAHNVVTQTSLLQERDSDYKHQVEELKKQKKTLEGKISGYHFLGKRLKERDEECKKLLQEKKDLEEKLDHLQRQNVDPPVVPSNYNPIQTEEKDIQTSFLSGYNLLSQSQHIQLPTQMQTSINKSSVRSTDLFPSQHKGPVQVTTNGLNNTLSSNETKRTAYDTSKTNRQCFPSLKTEDLFLSGPKHEIYEPPKIMYPPFVNRNDQENTGRFDVVMNQPPSDLDRRPIINGHVTAETKGKMPAVYPPIATKKNMFTEASTSSPSESLDLMMFSGEHSVTYPPISQKIYIPPDTGASIQTVTQTAKDLSLDGPPADLKKYFEETLLPELDKQEQKYRQQEKMVEDCKIEMFKLRDENQRLKIQLQESNLTPAGSLSPAPEWDFVKRTEALQAPLLGSDQSVALKLKALEQQNRRLVDANKQWQDFYESNKVKIQASETRILTLEQEIETLKTQDEQKRADFEKILCEAKQHQSDEEMAKEEALGQVAELNGQINQLQGDLRLVNTTLASTIEDKNLIQLQLNALRGNTVSGNYMGTNNRSVIEMESEIQALRQQLTLFQEDFDKERRDRAQAQSQKDQLQTQIEATKRELKAAQTKTKETIRQLQSAETNVRQTMMFNHQLQQELVEVKNQLRAEREANARPQYQPIPGNQHGGGYFNPQLHREARITAQPQAEPYAEPVPQYKIQQQQQQWNRPNVPGGMTGDPFPMPVRNRTPELHAVDMWSCEKCTLKNDPNRIVCEACGFNRAAVNNGHGIPVHRNNSSNDLMPRGDGQNLHNPDNNINNQPGDLSNDTGHLAQL